jgi:hypothetical protein
MKRGINVAAVVLLIVGAGGCAQTRPSDAFEIAPGFSMRQNGVIDIGDVYLEVNYYDSKWTIAQQHDRFALAENADKAADGAHVISGVLTTAAGPANFTEHVKASTNGVNYAATFASEKALETNELSMAFILPLASFGGKEILFDQTAVGLSKTAPAKGAAKFFEKDGIHRIELPTESGKLIITGNFYVLLQDDREWGDPRYSLRLYFTPGSGEVTQSKIELQMEMKPIQ